MSTVLEVVGLVVAALLVDVVKEGTRWRFDELRRMGIRTVMITGDNERTARAIAAEAGVDDVLAEATPEDKLALIRREQAGDRLVGMTGDGTNDAPALGVRLRREGLGRVRPRAELTRAGTAGGAPARSGGRLQRCRALRRPARRCHRVSLRPGPGHLPDLRRIEVGRVARERGVSRDRVRALVARATVGRDLGFIGDPYVNVLELNLSLDRELP